MTDTFSTWLNQQFLEWERQQGRRKSVTAFAHYLNVPQASLSEWMDGKYIPSADSLRKIAAKLGYEVYDALGIQRPFNDDRLAYIISIWSDLDENGKQKLFDLAKSLPKQFN